MRSYGKIPVIFIVCWLCAAVLYAASVAPAQELPPSATAPGAEICSVLAPYAQRVEEAVERGLRYLISSQQADGSFRGQQGGAAGVVSLAGMSFLAAGYTPGRDEYGQMINRCLDYVLAQQDESGYILADGRNDRGMYSHHISTLFLSEVSGMVDPQREDKVRDALARAVRVILSSQDAPKSQPRFEGGWRYSPSANDSDLSVSGWGVMALRSARLNGAPVPDDNIRRAVDYVRRMQHSDRGSFGYMSAGDRARVSLTGIGVLCLALTGHHDSEEVERGMRYMMNNYRNAPDEQFAIYGTYYAVQAAFQLGGRAWKEIGSWLYETYLPKQQADGSWGHPDAAGSSPSERGTDAYNTALIVHALAVPYRQLPVYQRDETVDE